jgi:FixJ family two-component response regulator
MGEDPKHDREKLTAQQTVFVVDDEPQARESVRALVHSMGMSAAVFHSAEEFLDQYHGEPGCVITDFRMAGLNGIEMQEELSRRECHLPVIVVTAYASTPMTVQAIQNGAVTLLDKPYDDDHLWQAIREALAADTVRRNQLQTKAELQLRMESLTNKERDVLKLMLQGKSNKTMAGTLDVSLRTIENRRRSIFTKFGTQSVAELVALVLKLQGT